MPVHSIELRGPWEWSRDEGWQRIKPAGQFEAILSLDQTPQLRRRFHKPTNLDDDESVHIVITSLAGPVTVSINGESVGHAGSFDKPGGDSHSFAADITDRLEENCVLHLDFETAQAERRSPLWEKVSLEIRSPG